mgnify:FL=1
MLSDNLAELRRSKKFSQEQVAEALDVSRQAVAKWESGKTVPDLNKWIALAELYGVSLDDLVQYDSRAAGLPIPPKGKHLFGTVTIGEKGQIVIPKKAREMFDLQPGDDLLVLGEEGNGLALMRSDVLLSLLEQLKNGGERP